MASNTNNAAVARRLRLKRSQASSSAERSRALPGAAARVASWTGAVALLKEVGSAAVQLPPKHFND
jgi:hypothetical protein